MHNLIDTNDLTKADILRIFKETDTMLDHLEKGEKDLKILAGKSIVLLFYENSTRTALSFELAGKYLGATVSSLAVSTSSVNKGESLEDTALTIDAFGADLVIMRHQMSGAPDIVAKNIKGKVINGGDGLHAHPTQALYDLYTISKHFKNLDNLKVSIIGDIKHSRVARSNINVLNKFSIVPTIYAPATLMPMGADKLGDVRVATSIEDAIADADVVMGLRIQTERQKAGLLPSISEYAKFYGINSKNISLAKPNAIIMHPGPINRGAEFDHVIVNSDQCVKDTQAKYGLALRMALIKLILE